MAIDPERPGLGVDLLSDARGWVLKLRSGDAKQRDLEAFVRWRDQSTAHRSALAEANAQWDVARLAARNLASRQVRVVHAADSTHVDRPFGRRAFIGGAAMASVGAAAYLVARPPLELWPSFAELTADYRTGVGERRQVTLSDDISVEMNTRTSVVVPRSGRQAIELISGEIAVTTGSGPSTPSRSVSIIAGNGRTSGSRAAFDVRYDGGKAFAACFEGEILVECGGARATLKARQQIAYADAGLSDIVSTDGRAIAAWREGLLVFENQPLSQVVSEINRYRRGRIILMNEDVGRLPLDATFRLDRIDEIVPEISNLFDLKIRALPGGVVLLG